MYTIKTSNCPLSVCTHPSEPCIFVYATTGMEHAVTYIHDLLCHCGISIIDTIYGIDLHNSKLNLFELSRCDKPFTYVELVSSSELIIRYESQIMT